MGKLIDLSGKRFGRLTVIERCGTYISPGGAKQPKWLCRCDCGNETEVVRGALTNGSTKSCGCLNKELSKTKGERKGIDLVGKRFGRLIVVERKDNKIDNKGKSERIWLCKCDCGNETSVRSGSLLRKKQPTRSCGCLNSEYGLNMINNARESDRFEGTRVGALNMKINSNNTSGVKGVCREKRRKKWMAYIQIRGKHKFLGYFDFKEDAIKARKEAEERYFKPIVEEFNEVRKDESYRCINSDNKCTTSRVK